MITHTVMIIQCVREVYQVILKIQHFKFKDTDLDCQGSLVNYIENYNLVKHCIFKCNALLTCRSITQPLQHIVKICMHIKIKLW